MTGHRGGSGVAQVRSSTTAPPLVGAVREALRAAADGSRAPGMQAYMKSEMPFLGVSVPTVRAICARLVADSMPGSAHDFEAVVRELFFDAVFREERYAAVAVARSRQGRGFQDADRIPLYRDLVVTGAWWDTVDDIAAHLVGPLLLADPSVVRPELVAWTRDDNRWLRRTSIIAQLGAASRTDLDLLTIAVDANAADRDFFIRKAIGWALRQYARTDPQWVRTFVSTRESELSALSKREACKHL